MRNLLLISALVCGAFGIGSSEFLAMGLLPQIAADFNAHLYAVDPDTATAMAAWMVSAYALGVVVGTLLTPILIRRLTERTALTLCAASMALWTLLTVLSPTLGVAITMRFLAALTHATYTGLASVTVARLLGSRHHGRGNAIVIGGLTVSNLLSVPILTALGTDIGWRIVLGLCSALFVVPVIALLLIPPPTGGVHDGDDTPPAGRNPYGRAILLVAALTLITGGGFAIMTFAAPITRWTQGANPVVPVATFMFIFGIGMNIGNFAGGWAADRSARIAVLCTSIIGVAGIAALILPVKSWVLAAIGIASAGILLSGANPSSMVLYLRALPQHPRLAASLASGTGNLGSFTGSLFGSLLLAVHGIATVGIGAIALIAVGLTLFASYCIVTRSASRSALIALVVD